MKPWLTEEGRVVWKTESQYWQWLRGALRRLWSDYPLRQVWKQSQLRWLTEEEKLSKKYHPSTKKVGQCSFCKDWMAGSKLECDHLVESAGCISKETAEQFLWHCGGTTAQDFRLACKPCHKIQTYSQRMGMTYLEARAEKEAISIVKTKQDKEWLKRRGLTPSNSASKRRMQIVEELKRD